MRTLLGLAAGMTLLGASAAQAQDVVAGWEGEPGRGYAFVAPTLTVGEAAPRHLILRTSASFLYYELGHADGKESVRSPGAAVGLGLRISRQRVTFALVPGYEIRRTDRRTAPHLESASVVERGPTLQGEMFVRATDITSLMLLGSYGHANRYTWTRVGVSRAVPGAFGSGPLALRLGLDATLQGNADFQTLQAGPALDIGFGPLTAMQVRGGYSRHQASGASATRRGYAAVGLYRRF